MKISKLIYGCIKILIAISLLFIVIGVSVHIIDVYVFRDFLFIGIPLLLIALIFLLGYKIYEHRKSKKMLIKLFIILMILCISLIAMYLIFGAVMEAVSH